MTSFFPRSRAHRSSISFCMMRMFQRRLLNFECTYARRSKKQEQENHRDSLQSPSLFAFCVIIQNFTMATSDSEDPWCISVKAVGLTLVSDKEEAAAASETNANGERNFVVEVSPDDAVASLHDKIEGATGLKASQQRLIYRGRLIGKCEQKEEEAKIKDIAGLCDGQTIHLVKKRETQAEDPNSIGAEEASQNASSRSNVDTDILGGSSGTGSGGSLLAAMLGLSGLPGDTNDEQNIDATTTTSTTTRGPRWGWRSSRLGGRSRRPHYRLTAEDLDVADPGTMEPVRQGLMTLHTLLPHARQIHSDQVSSPLQANREWYRGQWIDCRDTVNQWLEATIVEIMEPEEILLQRDDDDQETGSELPRHQRLPRVANDPAVSAADLEGRRRLLLEPCDPGDNDEEDGSLSGFRRRRNNDGVQLLLIHYNGWPHRWDEWIRSDSERIRPFRTRTRHPNAVSSSFSCLLLLCGTMFCSILFCLPFCFIFQSTSPLQHHRRLNLYLMMHLVLTWCLGMNQKIEQRSFQSFSVLYQ